MMDNVLMGSGIQFNMLESTNRNLNTLNDYLNLITKDEQAKTALPGG